ncbi:uncharacterized protein CTRU02_207495 [Colletotrichum truncatum]|uniref:Uncharacterized protein n=1 Tax=Colletotrichum truncatum TaxID=5467 RepID=A0ACC3Z105_COLTU
MEVIAVEPFYKVINQTRRAQHPFGTSSGYNMTDPPLPFLAAVVWELLPPAGFVWIVFSMYFVLVTTKVAIKVLHLTGNVSLVYLLWRRGESLTEAVIRVVEDFRRHPPPSVAAEKSGRA